MVILQLKMTLIGDGNENEDFFNYYQSIIEEISSTVKFNDQYKYSDFASRRLCIFLYFNKYY